MIRATIKRSAALLLGAVLVVGLASATYAQDKPVMDEEGFIFFINGANVQIPQLNGTSTVDPLDPTSGNRVFEIPYAGWSEGGFRWPSGGQRDTVGVDASAYTGTNYGESDTLYVRFKSDTANLGRSDFIALMDTDDGVMNAPIPDGTDSTVTVNEDADLPFRLRWHIPNWAHDGEWHTLAIPLPPATKAQLDSAKAGKNYDGSDLAVEVDSLFMNWYYEGAWANGTANGHWDESSPYWTEFDWEAVKFFGRHVDHADGGASFYFDYFSIGVPPPFTDTPPSAVANVSGSAADGVNTVTWDAVSGSGGYRIYFSEAEITDITAAGVANIGAVAFDGTRSVTHSITAPHPDLAEDFSAHYAVTALSQFGSESDPSSIEVVGDAKVNPNYAAELSSDAIDAIYDAIDDYSYPDAQTIALSHDDIVDMFPDGYQPFAINEKTKKIINGHGGDSDADISGNFWLGFGSDLGELIVYAEITDDASVLAPSSGENPTQAAWAYDSWEFGLGNYEPASFIISTTHTAFQSGSEPDYQFRAGRFPDRSPFIHVNGSSGALDGEVPNSQTIADTNATGYRLLTLISTVDLVSTFTGDVDFEFPTGTEVKLFPLNLAINDADDPVTNRDTQIGYSNRIDESVDDWWNNPTRWQTIAFAGADASYVVVSNEEEPENKPLEFALDQNYPNPFNPTTKISFTLATTADVTLEVYNLLGQKVATLLHNEKMTAGKYTQTFDAGSLASGMYFYRISTPSFATSRKMMLIK